MPKKRVKSDYYACILALDFGATLQLYCNSNATKSTLIVYDVFLVSPTFSSTLPSTAGAVSLASV